jgi:hypothetical protein
MLAEFVVSIPELQEILKDDIQDEIVPDETKEKKKIGNGKQDSNIKSYYFNLVISLKDIRIIKVKV